MMGPVAVKGATTMAWRRPRRRPLLDGAREERIGGGRELGGGGTTEDGAGRFDGEGPSPRR